jgi:hypothetical protein
VHLKLPTQMSTFMLPVNTLIFRSAGLQAATVTGGNQIALIDLALGRDFGSEVEVVSGLNGDESVVLNPPDSLATGQTVRIAPSAGTGGEAK